MPTILIPELRNNLNTNSRLSNLCAASVGVLLNPLIFLPVRFSTSRIRTVPSWRSIVKSVTLILPSLLSLSFTQFANVVCCIDIKTIAYYHSNWDNIDNNIIRDSHATARYIITMTRFTSIGVVIMLS